MIATKPIVPKGRVIDATALTVAVRVGLDTTALKHTKPLFETTVATWSNPPAFEVRENGPWVRIVGTKDMIYAYVSGGTRPHVIVPRKGRYLVFKAGGRAKTAPGKLGSTGGRKGGGSVFARRVFHPGIKARNFNVKIRPLAEKRLASEIQKAIRETLARRG